MARNTSLIFEPMCTLPEFTTPFVESPNTRGTSDILLSCMFTLIICTWNIQHLSVPHFDPKAKRSSQYAFRTWLRLSFKKAKWMIIAMIAPEYMLGLALNDYVAAKNSVEEMKGIAESRGFEWSMVHAYYANMGGMVLKFRIRAPHTSIKPRQKTVPQLPFRPNETGTRFEIQDLQQARLRDEAAFRGGCPHPYPYYYGCPGCQPPKLQKRPSGLAKMMMGDVPYHFDQSNESPVERSPTAPTRTDTERTLVAVDEDGVTLATKVVPMYLADEEWKEFSAHTDPRINIYENHSHASSFLDSTSVLSIDKHYPEWIGTWALTASQIRVALEMGIIDAIQPLSVEEIEDKSKSDAFVKVTAILQVIWLICQVIACTVNKLATSQLEIAVLAFAILTCITYALLWNKPQDVHIPSIINPISTPTSPHHHFPNYPTIQHLPLLTRPQIAQLATYGPWWLLNGPRTFWLAGINITAITSTSFFPGAILFPRLFNRFKTQCTAYHFGFGVSGALFGALHCIAWSYTFPSHREMRMWRVASVYCAVWPLLSTVFVICAWPTFYRTARKGELELKRSTMVNAVMWFVFGIPYSLARVYVMVESVRALAYLPPDAYRTVDWSGWLIHAG